MYVPFRENLSVHDRDFLKNCVYSFKAGYYQNSKFVDGLAIWP